MTSDRIKSRGDDPHAIFAFLYAIYLIAQHFYLYRGFYPVATGWEFAILPTAFLLVFFPRNLLLFVVLAGMHMVQTISVMPIFSNHTIMSAFFTAGLLISYVCLAISERSARFDAAKYYAAYAPLGRCMLLIMYFYGTLHKINPDFLSSESSCAVVLWRRYDFPEIITHSEILHNLAMYGTLILEASVIVMLLTRRFRWLGIVLGVSFHGFLGSVPPGYIIAYSVLAIMLHSLFLPPDVYARFAKSTVGSWLLAFFKPRLRLVVLALAVVYLGLFLPVLLTWTLVLVLFIAFVVAFGREPRIETSVTRLSLRSPLVLLNILTVVFFLNGLSPYFGFKTGQTIAMFSNLYTENSKTNHYFMPSVNLFGYQDRIATILDTTNPLFEKWRSEGYQVVEYQVLDYIDRYPSYATTFEIDGEVFVHTPEAPLAAGENLAPQWARKLMVFRPVYFGNPRICDSY